MNDPLSLMVTVPCLGCLVIVIVTGRLGMMESLVKTLPTSCVSSSLISKLSGLALSVNSWPRSVDSLSKACCITRICCSSAAILAISSVSSMVTVNGGGSTWI